MNRTNSQTSFDYTVDVIKINGKKLTATLFKQIYSAPPYDDDYNLKYELKGKVNHGKEHVLFTTPDGLRKWDFSWQKEIIRITSFKRSLYEALHPRLYSNELNHFEKEIHHYYLDLDYDDFEEDERNWISDVINNILDNRVLFDDYEKDSQVLLRALSNDFRAKLDQEYQNGIQRNERRNKMIKEFTSAPQIFL